MALFFSHWVQMERTLWNSSDSSTLKLWIPRICSFIWSKRRAHNSARALIQSKGNGWEVWVTVWVTVWWGIWRYLLDIHHFTSFYVKKESFLNCKLQIWMSKMSRRWCSSSDTKGQLPGWPFAVSPYPLLHLLDLLQDICDIPNPGGLILDRGFYYSLIVL